MDDRQEVAKALLMTLLVSTYNHSLILKAIKSIYHSLINTV